MAPPIDREALLKTLSDGVVVCSKSGAIMYANPAFSRTLGYSEEQLKNRNMAKDIVERDLEWKALVSLIEQGSLVSDYELKFKKADGTCACASISASNLRDDAGSFVGIAIVFRDISTRKRIESDLRDQAFRVDVINKISKIAASELDARRKGLSTIAFELRKLVNFDLLTVGVTEENGRHVDVLLPEMESGRAEQSLGTVPLEGSIVEKLRFSPSPIIAQKDAGRRQFTELTLLDSARIASMVCVPMMSRGHVIGSLNLYHSKPGEYGVETADLLQVIADHIAGLIDNIVLFSYLEKKIRLQELLLKSGVEIQKAISTQEIYATIAQNLKEVVYYIDLSIYVVDWQKRMIYPVYAVGGYKDEVLAAPGPIEEGVVGCVARSGTAEFTDDIDADPRAADIPGVPRQHNSMLAIPLMGSEGVLGVLELYRPKGQVFTKSDLDVGQLFAQQASVALGNANLVSKLQDVKKEIELLNDLMFHDINNYNFAVLNYIQMISNSPEMSPEHKIYLEKSIHLVRQTADLIENVKKLTKIGIMTAEEFRPIDLTGVLRKVVSGLENSFPGKEISVSMDVPETSTIRANKLVEELFVNLLSNSVKYDPHEEVELDVICKKTSEEGRPFWSVCISDRGTGIPDHMKPQLFQKYVRLKPDPQVQGTGLGLSICRALADKFGGRIWVEDRVQGKHELGARFCVMLPADRGTET